MANSANRQRSVLEHLEQSSFVNVADLARELGCSEMTIRRDLRRLENEGKLSRKHGGAVPSRLMHLEFALAAKALVNRDRKKAIARRAAQLIKPGQRLILDTGTTVMALANAMSGMKDITVVTNSLANASALMSAPDIECILLGGTIRKNSPDLYGPLATENLGRMHAEAAFIGCDAIDNNGRLMTTDCRVAMTSRMIISNSDYTVLLTDSSKAGTTSFVSFAELKEVDALVTDRDFPAELREIAESNNVEVLIADD